MGHLALFQKVFRPREPQGTLRSVRSRGEMRPGLQVINYTGASWPSRKPKVDSVAIEGMREKGTTIY